MRPFSCGSQYADWTAANCKRCSRGSASGMRCAIEDELLAAYLGDGMVCDPLAERMGALSYKGFYLWVCPEAVFADPETSMAAHKWLAENPPGRDYANPASGMVVFSTDEDDYETYDDVPDLTRAKITPSKRDDTRMGNRVGSSGG